MTKRSYSLAELAEHINVPKSPEDIEIDGIASLRDAQPNQISFYANSKQRDFLTTTRAGAVLIKLEDQHLCKQPVLLCENPYLAFARLTHLFRTDNRSSTNTIHPTADIAAGVCMGEGVFIGAGVAIGRHCTLADGVTIGVNCTIGDHCNIGENTLLKAHVVLADKTELGPACHNTTGCSNRWRRFRLRAGRRRLGEDRTLG